MKHTYAFLAVLVFATSTGSAQLIRLVAKVEENKILETQKGENNFAQFEPNVGYSKIVEVPDGEALRPLQLNVQDDNSYPTNENMPKFDYVDSQNNIT